MVVNKGTEIYFSFLFFFFFFYYSLLFRLLILLHIAILKQFVDEVDVREKHATAAISFQL